MQTGIDRTAIVAELMRGWREHRVVTMPSRGAPGFAIVDALAVAEDLRASRLEAGETAAGYKVGFTNAAVRAQFAADGRLAATVYGSTVTSERTIAAASFLGPRIEPEVVFGVDRNGICWSALAFEIVQSHAADWDFTWLDAVADFGLHAALIVGPRRDFSNGDGERLARMQVRLLRDGTVVEVGGGSAIDGGPHGSVDWLRRQLAEKGRSLNEGELVATGSMTRVPTIGPGQRWEVKADDGELPALAIDVV